MYTTFLFLIQLTAHLRLIMIEDQVIHCCWESPRQLLEDCVIVWYEGSSALILYASLIPYSIHPV